MSYYSSRDPYNRYAIIRWWCQNQWWVQIVVPCIVCAGVIGALLYQWNSEQQAQDQKKIFEAQYQYWKDNPPELDPDLEEVKTAWRVIRMKKNDPSMPIPYKKKQLIVKHWKSIIVDMKPEERYAAEIYDGQVRLSVGIEDVQDLIDDLDQALDLI